jgi:hypothetical protein
VTASIPPAQRPHAAIAIHAAFVDAMHEILLVGGIVAFAGAILGLLLVRGRDFATYAAPQPAPSAVG